MNTVKRAFGHFSTVSRHKFKVFQCACKAGIPWRGFMHDFSKFSPTEFLPGIKYYTGTRSPNEPEREENGYSLAWMHHKGRNRHHFEYWTDYNPQTKRLEPVEMPRKYLIEMFCDRVAASKIYFGENYTDSKPLEYYKRGCATRLIHPKTAEEIEYLLTLLAEKGEKAAFGEIRKKGVK